MPVRVRVSAGLGLIVIGCNGVVTAMELERSVVPLIEKPEYSLLPLALVDMTAAERFDGPSEVLRRNARRVGDFVDQRVARGSRMAIVAATDEFFGLGRMYEMLRGSSPVEFQVFRSLGEAEQWLGLRPGYEAELGELP